MIRRLQEKDWGLYKDMRLKALKMHPDLFTESYTESKTWSDDVWRARLSSPDRALFGVFDRDKIVGITNIRVAFPSEDPNGTSAVLSQSFLLPAYRGQGLSSLLYEERLLWAQQKTGVEKVLVSHREGNEPSRRANQAFGFRLTHKEQVHRPDGTKATNFYYELKLSGP